MDTRTDQEQTDPEQRIDRLDEHECWRRLLSEQLGRLAFVADGRTEIVPLNYVVRGRRIVFRTSAHATLLGAQAGTVALEIDGWDRVTAWSVIARGALSSDVEPGALDLEHEIGLAPWAPDETGVRDTLVVLDVHGASGRTFHRRVDDQERWIW